MDRELGPVPIRFHSIRSNMGNSNRSTNRNQSRLPSHREHRLNPHHRTRPQMVPNRMNRWIHLGHWIPSYRRSQSYLMS